MNAQRSLRQRVEVEEVYPQGARRIRKGGIAANGCAAPARITIPDWPGVAADASGSEPCRQARPSVLTHSGKTLPQAGSACRGCSSGRVPTKRRSVGSQRPLRQRVEVEDVYPQGARRIRKGGIASNGCAAPARITIPDWPDVAADASQSEPRRQARPSVLTRGGKTLPQAGSACRGYSIGRVPTERRSVGLATPPAAAG